METYMAKSMADIAKKALNKAQGQKISDLYTGEGYPLDQAIAISYSERESGGLARLNQSHPKTPMSARPGQKGG